MFQPFNWKGSRVKNYFLDTLGSWFLTQNLTEFYQDRFYRNEWKQEHCRETSHWALASHTFPF